MIRPDTPHRRPTPLVLLVAGLVLSLLVGSLTTTAQAAGSQLTGDDFDGPGLSPIWTLTHPAGTASASVASGQAAVSLPAGPASDAWGSNTAARLLQPGPTGGEDFSVQAKFDSLPSKKFQDQGLIVEQSADRWLRFGLYSDGSKRFVFAATTSGGVSTQLTKAQVSVAGSSWLRLERDDGSYKFSWSRDGQQWTEAVTTSEPDLVPVSVGVYAGAKGATSSQSAAAWTVLVDEVQAESSGVEVEPSVPPTTTQPSAPTTSEPSQQPTAAEPSVPPSSEPSVPPSSEPTVPPVDPSTEPSADPSPEASAAPTPARWSDDFSGGSLSSWQVVDPAGGVTPALAGQGSSDARLVLALPAGTSRDTWNTNRGTRLLKQLPAGDVGVEVKFDSKVTARFQDQGLLLEQDPNSWLRFSIYSDGSKSYAFAATTVGGVSTQQLKKQVTQGASTWLRVEEANDVFTFSTSSNGTNWSTVGSVTSSMDVVRGGPYAGVSGGNPAFTSLVDYVFDVDDPVSPEDGSGTPDTVAPAVLSLTAVPGSANAVVSWTADELATGVLDVRPVGSVLWTQSISFPAAAEAGTTTLSGLQPQWDYELQLRLTDVAGNTSAPTTRTFRTSAASGPTIDVWYGNQQSFGRSGVPQSTINVVGNVFDPDGVTSLRYSLNSGAWRTISQGPDYRRLQRAGDFNADIKVADLMTGANSVRIEAVDSGGARTERTVTATFQPTAAPLPFTGSWDHTRPILEQVSSVDGRYQITSDDRLRVVPGTTGYDRLVAIGDSTWTDYEVTVPITVDSIGPGAGSYLSNEPLIGLAMRWQGHEVVDKRQPAWGYKGVGSYAWFRYYDSGGRFEMIGNGASPTRRAPATMPFGQEHLMKVRAVTGPTGTTYSGKFWLASAPEPAAWQLTFTQAGPAQGSLAFFAHHVEASFGEPEVRQLP